MDKAGSDGKTLRDKAIKAVDDTEFFPSWGRARLEAMIEAAPTGRFAPTLLGHADDFLCSQRNR